MSLEYSIRALEELELVSKLEALCPAWLNSAAAAMRRDRLTSVLNALKVMRDKPSESKPPTQSMAVPGFDSHGPMGG